MAYKDKQKEKEYKRQYYILNAEYIKKENAERKKIHRIKLTKFINRIKILFGCNICGYNKCANVLHFHHTGDKEKGISVMRRNTVSIKVLKKEIRKCVILCANCHGEVHAGLINLK